LILPHGKRLTDAANRMIELPYALYDSQDMLVRDIVVTGSKGIKKGLALLGGIQINTGPDTLDYFHPLRFDYMNNKGEVVEDLLPLLVAPFFLTK
jgi:Limiting CO2-inducible proteins B/C beta carbonyic anhydrases